VGGGRINAIRDQVGESRTSSLMAATPAPIRRISTFRFCDSSPALTGALIPARSTTWRSSRRLGPTLAPRQRCKGQMRPRGALQRAKPLAPARCNPSEARRDLPMPPSPEIAKGVRQSQGAAAATSRDAAATSRWGLGRRLHGRRAGSLAPDCFGHSAHRSSWVPEPVCTRSGGSD
jgi:hypothetical protein